MEFSNKEKDGAGDYYGHITTSIDGIMQGMHDYKVHVHDKQLKKAWATIVNPEYREAYTVAEFIRSGW